MLASFPASMVNQKPTDLGIPNRFKLKSYCFSGLSQAARRAGLSSFYGRIRRLPTGARHGVKDTGSDYSQAVVLRIEFSLVSAMFAPKAGRRRDGRASDPGA
jgi:hypothetical protein